MFQFIIPIIAGYIAYKLVKSMFEGNKSSSSSSEDNTNQVM